MSGRYLDWSVPFNPDDIGKQAMFVWIQSEDLAEDFVGNYCPSKDKSIWVRRWNSYGIETIYAISKSGDRWMFGDRDSLSASYIEAGYVPRIYLGDISSTRIEVGDLL